MEQDGEMRVGWTFSPYGMIVFECYDDSFLVCSSPILAVQGISINYVCLHCQIPFRWYFFV
jgi:hypothetical protein